MFNFDALRKFINETMGEKPSGNKLRPGLSTLTAYLQWQGYKFKVISTSEAKALKPKGTRPHRIFVWCEQCRSWQYAGKFAQHRKAASHQVKEAA